ncbi:TBP-associated factor 3 isoform X2 [Rhodnius prolixus]|uniref:TBP-associated factor 3 isoform X2 n=1 Tax=Rhodnius prolixus TaxID=13249 RepID=UPI003D18BBC4
MEAIDSYTRNCIKVSVAQICQVIGWTSIQSTPLEILTDLLQEYILSLARMSKNYANHYGMNTPGLQHVGLSLKTIGVSFHELAEYVSAVEAPPALDTPAYPLPRENHLNLLKPGSREVVTRPVHIHEHLPPVHPHLQDDDCKESLQVDVSQTEATSPAHSPKSLFKKPGDPDLLRRQSLHYCNTDYSAVAIVYGSPLRQSTVATLSGMAHDSKLKSETPAAEEEVRALREITSVMMTTSGYLSPAREGKLPEARTPSTSQATMTPSPLVTEKAEPVLPYTFPTKDRKKKKHKDVKSKDDKTCDQDKIKMGKDGKPKLPKTTKAVERSPSPIRKVNSNTMTPVCTLVNNSNSNSNNYNTNVSLNNSNKNSQRKQHAIPTPSLQVQNANLTKSSRSPLPEKSSTKAETMVEEVKLPAELDKHKLNIFKKISKVKDEIDVDVDVKEEEKWSGLDEVIDAVSRGNVDIKEEVAVQLPEVTSVKEEPELQIDVVSIPHKEPLEETHSVEVSRPSECKKKKKDKQKEVKHNVVEQNVPPISSSSMEQKSVKPFMAAIEEQIAKASLSLPTHDLSLHQAASSMPSSFPYYPFPSGVLTHPLIPQVPPVLGPYPVLQSTILEPPSQPTPNQAPPVLPSTSFSPPSIPQPSLMSSPKKKEHKKIKKLKEKLKKKKGKKEKNKAKIKSEKKRLKLEKKEREKEKLKSKKEKKEKKRDKEPSEVKPEVQNVPKITFKLSSASPQDSPSETCHRKIVIKPVVKKEDDKFDLNWCSSSNVGSVTSSVSSKSHKSQKNFKGGLMSTSASMLVEEPKIVPPSVAHSIHTIPSVSSVASRIEAQSEYICPACNRPDDGSPMIACDSCDLWFHWVCVGIQEPPESDWYCRKCTAKIDGISSEKRKKHKKKKSVF